MRRDNMSSHGADAPLRSPVEPNAIGKMTTGDGNAGVSVGRTGSASLLEAADNVPPPPRPAPVAGPKRSSNVAIIATHISMAIWIIFLLVWILAFEENGKTLSFSGLGLFQWHPFLMVLSFGIALGEAVIAFRSSSLERKTRKNIHSTCNFLAFVGSLLGLVAVLEYHNEMDIPHFYSAHSWLGLLVIVAMWSQYFAAVVIFGLEGVAPVWLKQKVLPFHRFGGKVMCVSAATARFVVAMVTIATGIMQRQSFTRAAPPVGPGRFGSVNMFANAVALIGVLAGASVMYHFES